VGRRGCVPPAVPFFEKKGIKKLHIG